MAGYEITWVARLEDVPVAVRRHSTLHDPAYGDFFEISAVTNASPQRWARAVLEEGSVARRSSYRFWRSIGLRLGPRGSANHVQGWRIDASGDDWLRLATDSWYLRAEVIVRCRAPGTTSLSLFLEFDHPVGRVLWAAIEPTHIRVVPTMLRQGAAVLEGRRTDR